MGRTKESPTATAPAPAPPAQPGGGGSGVARSTPVQLLLAAHPRQALATAVGVGALALLAGRPLGEVALVAATVLVGQAVLGWHNDLVDRERDRRADLPGKPLASGRLETGTVWFAVTVALLLLVPLAVANGFVAAASYLVALAIGLLGNVALRGSVLSPLPWMAQFAAYPAFVSYGGLGGRARATRPRWRSAWWRRCWGSASTCCAGCPGWSSTTARGCATCRCGWVCGSARRGRCCSPARGPVPASWPCCWSRTRWASRRADR